MTKGPGLTCFKDFSTSALYFPTLFSVVHVILLQFSLFPAPPAYAEEPKVFTDADLVNYNTEQMVDQETLSRMEVDLKSYEKKKDEEFLLEREKRRRDEDAKRAALQKQEAVVSGGRVSNQGSGTNSGTSYVRSPGSKRRT